MNQQPQTKQTEWISRSSPIGNFANDQNGFVVSSELLLIATAIIFGGIVALTSVRDAVVSEISDVAGAVQDLKNDYSFLGVAGHSGSTHGSDFFDTLDHCDSAEDISNAADNCIAFDAPPTSESSDGGTDPPKVATYSNADTATDISASQNLTQLKWALDRGNESDADDLTDCIADCIKAGQSVTITWTNTAGETFVFEADSFSGGPDTFLFTGTADVSGSGKINSATIVCVE